MQATKEIGVQINLTQVQSNRNQDTESQTDDDILETDQEDTTLDDIHEDVEKIAKGSLQYLVQLLQKIDFGTAKKYEGIIKKGYQRIQLISEMLQKNSELPSSHDALNSKLRNCECVIAAKDSRIKDLEKDLKDHRDLEQAERDMYKNQYETEIEKLKALKETLEEGNMKLKEELELKEQQKLLNTKRRTRKKKANEKKKNLKIQENEIEKSSEDVEAVIEKECGSVDIKNDFEDQMDKPISTHVEKLDKEQSIVRGIDKPSTSENAASAAEPLPVDGESREKTEEEKNDEFCDPGMDKADPKWIDDKKRAYIFPKAATSSSQSTMARPLPNSDAVLNCPTCLSLLCVDCQRHGLYNTQYRAMFVSNCNVITDEILSFPNEKKKKAPAENEVTNSMRSDKLNPVRCVVCNTDVAVYDSDEVYHFYNVLANCA